MVSQGQKELENLMLQIKKQLALTGYTKQELAFGVFFSSIMTYQIYETENVGALMEALGSAGPESVAFNPQVDV